MIPDAIRSRVLSYSESWRELATAAAIDVGWCAAAAAHELADLRVELARRWALPSVLDQLLAERSQAPSIAFCLHQAKLQAVFAGGYAGVVPWESDSSDGSQLRRIAGRLLPLDAFADRRGRATLTVYASDDESEDLNHFEWMVLDLRHHFDRELVASHRHVAVELVEGVEQVREARSRRGARGGRRLPDRTLEPSRRGTEPDAPEERWEDGDCFCGVRGAFDFRPVVDPAFLSVSHLAMMLVPDSPSSARARAWPFWGTRLFAPCAWMLPKLGEATLEELDHRAARRQDSTVAALIVGRHLERAVSMDELTTLLTLTRATGVEARRKPGGDRAAARRAEKAVARISDVDPRSRCSGKNPKGLNFFIPRRRCQGYRPRDGEGRVGPEDAAEAKVRPPRFSCLSCCADAAGLEDFLRIHRPTLREAERLSVGTAVAIKGAGGEEAAAALVGDDNVAANCDGRLMADAVAEPRGCPEGLLEDAQRLEAGGMLSHNTVVDLARKWHVLSGKWLLFVPEWRIDELFSSLARQLQSKGLSNCNLLVVSPPGAFGTDPNRFMLSAHCPDFTAAKEVMAAGKAVRVAAKEGLRTIAGDWGELQDDPFAPVSKKVALMFKPDVFSYLGIHRNNPYGIKPSLYVLDL